MRRKVKIAISMLLILVMTMMFSVTALADDIGDIGDTGQGNIGGTNVYTFSYIYDSSADAIKLRVDTKNPINSFGGTTSHTFDSPYDNLTLHTKNPRLGNSLENAVASMNSAGGYNLSVDYVKSALNAHGYYDKGNGIWITDGGYLITADDAECMELAVKSKQEIPSCNMTEAQREMLRQNHKKYLEEHEQVKELDFDDYKVPGDDSEEAKQKMRARVICAKKLQVMGYSNAHIRQMHKLIMAGQTAEEISSIISKDERLSDIKALINIL